MMREKDKALEILMENGSVHINREDWDEFSSHLLNKNLINGYHFIAIKLSESKTRIELDPEAMENYSTSSSIEEYMDKTCYSWSKLAEYVWQDARYMVVTEYGHSLPYTLHEKDGVVYNMYNEIVNGPSE